MGDRRLTIMVVPEGGEATHTYRLSHAWFRFLSVLAVVCVVALPGMIGSLWLIAGRSSRIAELERRVQVMATEQARIEGVAADLASAEAQYERIQALLVPQSFSDDGGIWLSSSATSSRTNDLPVATPTLPQFWPLTEKGVITQGLFSGVEGAHPGLDIAVQRDSYIRAAGGGLVAEVGTDDVYGRYVVIDHDGGYSSVYAHASIHLVEEGQGVREREVIALSGSSGQSTAPHLHFEILLNGGPIDPLSMVSPPN